MFLIPPHTCSHSPLTHIWLNSSVPFRKSNPESQWAEPICHSILTYSSLQLNYLLILTQRWAHHITQVETSSICWCCLGFVLWRANSCWISPVFQEESFPRTHCLVMRHPSSRWFAAEQKTFPILGIFKSCGKMRRGAPPDHTACSSPDNCISCTSTLLWFLGFAGSYLWTETNRAEISLTQMTEPRSTLG